MNNEEKILEMLEKLNVRMENLESGQAQLNSRMENLESGQARMQDDLTSVKLRLELDVEKRFDAVNEGIDSILEKLTPKSRVDEMEADIIVLKTAVKAMAQRIAELEKAQ